MIIEIKDLDQLVTIIMRVWAVLYLMSSGDESIGETKKIIKKILEEYEK